MNKIIMIGDSLVIRLKALSFYLVAAALVITSHNNLLKFGKYNGVIEFGAWMIIGLNNAVVSHYTERKQ